MQTRKIAQYVEAAKAHAARAMEAEGMWAEQHWRDAAVLWAKAKAVKVEENRR